MKKRVLSALLCGLLAVSMCVPAFAQEITVTDETEVIVEDAAEVEVVSEDEVQILDEVIADEAVAEDVAAEDAEVTYEEEDASEDAAISVEEEDVVIDEDSAAVRILGGLSYFTAATIQVDETFTDKLGINERRYYKFGLGEDGVLSVKAEGVPTEKAGWKFYIINSNKEIVMQQLFGHKPVVTDPLGVGRGLYYLVVEYAGDCTENYTLTVNYAKTKLWEKEKNDSFEEATPIGPCGVKYGISDLNDKDFFVLTAPCAGEYSMFLGRDSVQLYHLIEEYDSNMKLVRKYKDVAGRATKLAKLKKGEKRYYKITSFNNTRYKMVMNHKHNYKKVVIREATTKRAGLVRFQCKICKMRFTRPIPKLKK